MGNAHIGVRIHSFIHTASHAPRQGNRGQNPAAKARQRQQEANAAPPAAAAAAKWRRRRRADEIYEAWEQTNAEYCISFPKPQVNYRLATVSRGKFVLHGPLSYLFRSRKESTSTKPPSSLTLMALTQERQLNPGIMSVFYFLWIFMRFMRHSKSRRCLALQNGRLDPRALPRWRPARLRHQRGRC